MTDDALRVLLVDDSPEDRALYKRFLRHDPSRIYSFLEAETGEAGLEICRHDAPACVLLDYRLPDLDGIAFLAALHEHRDPPCCAVIVLTGQGSAATAVEAMKAGAHDYLAKDAIAPDSLVRAVHNALDKLDLQRTVSRHTQDLRAANDELRREVEQRREAERALQQMTTTLEQLVERRTAELARANRLKDEFLATVSHELRTPLNAILGWAQILRQDGLVPDMRARAVETIERNARSQGRIIDDILDISRIVAGKLRMDHGRMDLATVMESALDVVRPSAVTKGVAIDVELTGPAPVLGDAERLRQVLGNVLSNAVKFTPRGGRIGVRLEQAEEVYRVTVRDTGIGIAPAFLPFVFEPFRQGDATITRRHPGLGLGLAIGRQLVEMHGGTIAAASDGEHRGATITIDLPTASAASSAAARDARATVQRPGAGDLRGIDVLIVEDDPDARDLLTTALRQHGAEVRQASGAREALLRVLERIPRVLVSDIAMPDGDGYWLMRELRALPDVRARAVPAVAVTAYARPADRQRALEAGFQEHIVKPVDADRLASVVADLARAAGPSGPGSSAAQTAGGPAPSA